VRKKKSATEKGRTEERPSIIEVEESVRGLCSRREGKGEPRHPKEAGKSWVSHWNTVPDDAITYGGSELTRWHDGERNGQHEGGKANKGGALHSKIRHTNPGHQ